MMKKLLPFAIVCLLAITSYSQSIGIGTTTPHSSSVLDISSTDKGLLIPRMTTSGITAISNPAKGLMIYDSLKNQLMVNMGSATVPDWQTIVFNSGWSLGGNKGLNPANDFIGTTDNVSLVFKANNKLSGLIDVQGSGNTYFGLDAGKSTTSGTFNLGVGRSALASTTNGSWNTAIGYEALFSNTTGYDNYASGYGALRSNTSGDNNTAAGYNSLAQNANGDYNSAFGSGALSNNQTGVANTGVGYWALHSNSTGVANVAVGGSALSGNGAGTYNTAVGYDALNFGTGNSSSYNTAIGYATLDNTYNSQFNTCVGYSAGHTYNMGYNNTIIGANCDMNNAGYYNCIAVGQSVTNTAVSQARIGNAATNSIGGYANWSNISDGRYKKDIHEDVKGISFIMKLRPVTYHLDVSGLSTKLNESRGRAVLAVDRQAIAEKEKIVFSGFVAQEVEKAAAETGYDFSGVDKPKNENDLYALRYAEFVVPLVKGMQEQQKMIETLQQENITLRKALEQQQQQINKILSDKK